MSSESNKKQHVAALQAVSKNAKSPPAKVKHPFDLQSSLPFRVVRAGLYMSDAGQKLSELLKESGTAIGEREWRVLVILGDYGGLTNSQLVQISRIDSSTISRAVKVLSEIGFVGTRKSKKDRRRYLIYLTEAGAKFHDQLAPKVQEKSELVDACLTDKERADFFRMLDKIERNLQQMEIEANDEWE